MRASTERMTATATAMGVSPPRHRLSPCSALERCRPRPLGQALGDAHEVPTR
eukprot:SAG25_NODE_14962_length_193_cov_2801.851064_1_plen_51_part_01